MATQLTTQQLATLKAAILAETDPAFVTARTLGQTSLMTGFFNSNASPAFYVWRSSTPTTEIAAVVNWANYTPADTPDTTTLYTNRAMLCALKRDNMRTMLERDTLPTSRTVVRQNLTDALQNVPAGVGGAMVDAGWLGTDRVKDTIARPCTRAERLFVTGTGTAGQPGNLVWEGQLTDQDINAAQEA